LKYASLREPTSIRLAAMILEELKRRSKRNQRGEMTLGEAAAMLGCDENQVVGKIDALVKEVPDFWDWAIIHGEGFVAVVRRYTRREAARLKKLMKRPEFEQVRRLPPRAMFSAREASKTLNLPPREVRSWLARCARMGYLYHSVLVPSRGRRMKRWRRSF
jgi:predicted ArsR family transcriptional regulator